MERTRTQRFLRILLLGSLTALSPFSIDMYLPAFPQIAQEYGVSIGYVGLSLSSYFFGLAGGQLLYGPLLDRFGRKRPLFAGLCLYILASLACMLAPTAKSLIAIRALQALGGSAASVATMAMVRDLYSVKDSAKVFSLLVLILSASPLLAPTLGGFVAAAWGWKMVFVVLALIAAALLLASALWLPNSHIPDKNMELRPGPVLRTFWQVLREPQFYTFSLAGSVAFAGLFAYVSGAPILFLEVLKVSPRTFSFLFAFLSVGLIGAAQVNTLLLNHFRSEQIFRGALIGQTIVASGFLLVANLFGLTLPIAVGFLFSYLACLGLTSPNGSALALGPFSKNTGSASAMLGFLQMGIGAAASAMIGALGDHGAKPLLITFAGSAFLALTILTVGLSRIRGPLEEGGPGESLH